jgi:putative ABC transport system permease protein
MLNNIKVALFLASRSIRRGNPWISVFTILVLTLVFIQLVFLSSLLGGVSNKFNDLVVDYQTGNLVIEPKKDEIYISDVNSLIKKINNLPEIIGTSARLKFGATISYKEKYFPTTVYGIDDIDESQVTKLNTAMMAGDFLEKLDSGEIILGREVSGGYDATMQAKSLGEVKVGDKVTLKGNGFTKEFRVKGIYSTLFFISDASAYINKKDAEELLGVSDKANEIAIKIRSGLNEQDVKRDILTLGVKEEVRVWQDFSGILRLVTDTFQRIIFIFNVIGLIVAFVIIFVVIYVNIVNKKRQMGVQKAIGVDESVIIMSFLFMGIFYALIGMVLGYCIMRFGITNYSTIHPFKFPMGYIVLKMGGLQAVREAVLLFMAAVIGSLLPAIKMARKDLLDLIKG